MEFFECKICDKVFENKKTHATHIKSYEHERKELEKKEIKEEMNEKLEKSRQKKELSSQIQPLLSEYLDTLYPLLSSSPSKKEEGRKQEKGEGDKGVGEGSKGEEEENGRMEEISNKLSEEMREHYLSFRPTKIVEKRRKALCQFLKKVVQKLFSKSFKLEAFGSIPLHLDSRNLLAQFFSKKTRPFFFLKQASSDIDVSLYMEETKGRKREISRLCWGVNA